MIASIFEGVGLGVLLILYCLIGIKDGAVGMVHLYDKTVRQRCIELGLTTEEKIKKRAIVIKTIGWYADKFFARLCATLGFSAITKNFAIISSCSSFAKGQPTYDCPFLIPFISVLLLFLHLH